MLTQKAGNSSLSSQKMAAVNVGHLLAEYVDEPLVVVSYKEALPESAKIAAASKGAKKLLGLNGNNGHSAQIRKFVRLCATNHDSNKSLPEWKAKDGSCFALVPVEQRRDKQTHTLFLRLARQDEGSANGNGTGKRSRERGLSRREAEVVALMARGLSNSEIARDLGISYDTVRAHLRNIFAKLKVSSRLEAVQAAGRMNGHE